jgi:hypothetical protein
MMETEMMLEDLAMTLVHQSRQVQPLIQSESFDVSDGLSGGVGKGEDEPSSTLRLISDCHEGTGSPFRDAETICASAWR